MTRFNIPFRPVSGDDEIVEQLIGDFDHMQDIGNGNLQAGTNVKVTAPPEPPTGSHFESRLFYDTTTRQLKICLDPILGTYIVVSNAAPTELPTHGSSHGVGGSDELPDGGISSDMLGRSVQTTNLPAKVQNIK